MYATIISIFLILTQFFLTVPIFLDINIETNHSLKKQESNANTTGFDGVSFSKENSSVLSKMLWKLNGVLPKFCFREKWRQKFHEWRKMYCLDLFQMNQFRDFFFFNALQVCVFQCKSMKRWNGSKRMGFLCSDIPLLISNILIWAEDGNWNFSLHRNLNFASLTFSFLHLHCLK